MKNRGVGSGGAYNAAQLLSSRICRYYGRRWASPKGEAGERVQKMMQVCPLSGQGRLREFSRRQHCAVGFEWEGPVTS